MFSVSSSGSFKNTETFLQKNKQIDIRPILNQYGQEGVNALSRATPVDSGRAKLSWSYRVIQDKNGWTIVWENSDRERGFPVAIMLQYGYGTGTGGYVEGRDYINPSIRPIFDKIATEVWKAVTSA